MAELISVSLKQMSWEELSQIKISKLNEEELKTFKAQIYWGYWSSTMMPEHYKFIIDIVDQIHKN